MATTVARSTLPRCGFAIAWIVHFAADLTWGNQFEAWWKKFATDKKTKKQAKQHALEQAGLLEASPRPRELQILLAMIVKMLYTTLLE
jgi:hypothetical protein